MYFNKVATLLYYLLLFPNQIFQTSMNQSKGNVKKLSLDVAIYSVEEGSSESSIGALLGISTSTSQIPQLRPEADPDFTLIGSTLTLELRDNLHFCCHDHQCNQIRVQSHLMGPKWAQVVFPERNHSLSSWGEPKNDNYCSLPSVSLCSCLESDGFRPLTSQIQELSHRCETGSSSLHIDISPIVQRWVETNEECYDRSLEETLIFSIVIDSGVLGPSLGTDDLPKNETKTNLSQPKAMTLQSIITRPPKINLEYYIDRK